MAADVIDNADFTSRPRWAVLAIILVGAVATATAISGIAVALPKIEAALAHTPEEKYLIKMLVGAVGAAMVIGAPVSGFLSDRVELRYVVLANWILFTLAGTAGMYLNELHALVVARFLLGIAAAGAVTCSVIVVNRLIPRGERAKWMGRYVSLSYVMNICLQPLVGQLAERDWHYSFVIYAIGAPVCVIAMFWFPTGSRSAPPPVEAGPHESFLTWFPFRLGLVGLAIGWVTYITVIYMPFLLRSWGIGPAMASFVLTADTITGIVASLVFGRARRHLTWEGAFVVAFGVGGVGTLITSCAPNYPTVMIGMAMLGFAGGWFLPNLMLAVGETVAAYRQGRTTGLVKAFNYLSMPVGLTLIEGPAQIYGPRLPIAISAILAFVVVAALAYRIHARKKQGVPVVAIGDEGKAAA